MVNRLGQNPAYFPDFVYQRPKDCDPYQDELDELTEARHVGRHAVLNVLNRNSFVISIGTNCDMSPTHAKLYREMMQAAQDFGINTKDVSDKGKMA